MKTYIPHLQKFHSVELSKKVKKLQKKKKKCRITLLFEFEAESRTFCLDIRTNLSRNKAEMVKIWSLLRFFFRLKRSVVLQSQEQLLTYTI